VPTAPHPVSKTTLAAAPNGFKYVFYRAPGSNRTIIYLVPIEEMTQVIQTTTTTPSFTVVPVAQQVIQSAPQVNEYVTTTTTTTSAPSVQKITVAPASEKVVFTATTPATTTEKVVYTATAPATTTEKVVYTATAPAVESFVIPGSQTVEKVTVSAPSVQQVISAPQTHEVTVSSPVLVSSATPAQASLTTSQPLIVGGGSFGEGFSSTTTGG